MPRSCAQEAVSGVSYGQCHKCFSEQGCVESRFEEIIGRQSRAGIRTHGRGKSGTDRIPPFLVLG